MDTRLIHLDETVSTQDVATANYSGSPLLVVANKQTRGRGRDDRHWENAPRPLAMSLAFSPSWPTSAWPRLALVAGLVVASLVDGARLKWPNDVLLNGQKIAGILVEGKSEFVVVGVGINLWWPHAPEGYGAAYEDDPGEDAPVQLASLVVSGLLERVELGPAEWGIGRYRDLCETIGRRITWEPDGEGDATGIGESGALLVNTADGTRELFSGEVRHIRKLG